MTTQPCAPGTTMDVDYMPIFSTDEHELVVLHSDFIARSDAGARHIALGSLLLEAVVFGFQWTGRVLRVENGAFLHTQGHYRCGGAPLYVAILPPARCQCPPYWGDSRQPLDEAERHAPGPHHWTPCRLYRVDTTGVLA